jgi:hypothetical protein
MKFKAKERDLLGRYVRQMQTFRGQDQRYCSGGGTELVMARDFRIAADTAIMGVPEIKLVYN